MNNEPDYKDNLVFKPKTPKRVLTHNWAQLYTIKIKIKELQNEYEKYLDELFEETEKMAIDDNF